MRLEAPATAELGTLVEIAVHLNAPGSVSHLLAFQRSKMGQSRPEPLKPARIEGDTAFVQIIPRFLGADTVEIVASFDNHSVALQRVAIQIAPPKSPPLLFRANILPDLVLVLNDDTRMSIPRPFAIYPEPVGRLFLNSSLVKYRVVSQPGLPVVYVDPAGVINAVREGDAYVEARFGASTDRLHVIVRTKQQ